MAVEAHGVSTQHPAFPVPYHFCGRRFSSSSSSVFSSHVLLLLVRLFSPLAFLIFRFLRFLSCSSSLSRPDNVDGLDLDARSQWVGKGKTKISVEYILSATNQA